MSIFKIIALLLIAAGVFALIYGGFTYTQETHDAAIGPLSISVDENQYVSVPIWAGVVSIVLGSLLLLSRGKV